jgi:hypothetical protein
MNSDGNIDNTTSMLSAGADTEDDSTMFAMPKSPGSFLGSSIRSNQVESFDIESESCSVNGENSGWRLGTPWFSNNNHNRDMQSNNLENQEVNKYYGGIMKPSGESSTGPASPNSTTSNSSRHFGPFRKKSKRPNNSKNGKSKGNQSKGADESGSNISKHQKDVKDARAISDRYDAVIPISRTKSSTGDSIADFDESEWTQPDSSYGAACPVCGCIPKRVRQIVEMTLIAGMVFLLIYLVVAVSMKIADAHRKNKADASAVENYFNGNNYNNTGSNSASSTNVVTDDDVYVEKYSSSNDDGTGDDAAVVDNYNDDYNVDDAGDYSQNNNYNNNGNSYGNNKYYSGNSNQNYNYYNRNRRYYRNNGNYRGRRQLRSSQGNRIKAPKKREIQ